MCPGVTAMPNYVEGVCQALQGTLNVSSWVWSGYPYGTNNALIVVPLNGLVGYNSFSVNGYAFCE